VCHPADTATFVDGQALATLGVALITTGGLGSTGDEYFTLYLDSPTGANVTSTTAHSADVFILANEHTPIIYNGSGAIDQGQTLASQGSLLDNAYDLGGDAMSLTEINGSSFPPGLATATSHGSVTINEDGSYTYTPSSSYVGGDSFTYTVNSGSALATATVELNVNYVPPTVLPVPTQASVASGSSNANLKGLAISDPHASAISGNVSVVVHANQGTINVNNVTGGVSSSHISGNGTSRVVLTGTVSQMNTTLADSNGVDYSPDSTFNGDDDVTMTVQDSDNSLTTSMDVPLTVTPPAPSSPGTTSNPYGSFVVNVPAEQTMVADSWVPLDGIDVSIIDATEDFTDSEGHPGQMEVSLTAANGLLLITRSASGVTLEGGDGTGGNAYLDGTLAGISALLAMPGAVEYRNESGFAGVDTVTVLATTETREGSVLIGPDTSSSVVSILVKTNPVANPDGPFVVYYDGGPYSDNVLNNDTDSYAHAMKAMLVSTPKHGSLTFDSYGDFTYTALNNYTGPDDFQYRFEDGFAVSNVAEVTLDVRKLGVPWILYPYLEVDFAAEVDLGIFFRPSPGASSGPRMSGSGLPLNSQPPQSVNSALDSSNTARPIRSEAMASAAVSPAQRRNGPNGMQQANRQQNNQSAWSAFWGSLTDSYNSVVDGLAGAYMSVAPTSLGGNSQAAQQLLNQAYQRGPLGQTENGPAWAYYTTRTAIGVATFFAAAAVGVGGVEFVFLGNESISASVLWGGSLAPVAGWSTRLAGADLQIMQTAASTTTRGAGFMNHLGALAQSVAARIPGGQIHLLGRINGSPVYGSLVSGTGIAEVNGVTMVVKQTAQGIFEILGPFIP
jgi:hypothetical protein